MLNKRADKLELLRIAGAVALEKSIDKELIIDSMETGIAKAAKSKFGQENEIKVLITRDNGDIGIFRKLVIVEKPENTNTEINLKKHFLNSLLMIILMCLNLINGTILVFPEPTRQSKSSTLSILAEIPALASVCIR